MKKTPLLGKNNFQNKHERTKRRILAGVLLLFTGIFLFFGYRLLSYFVDYIAQKQINTELKSIYYRTEEETVRRNTHNSNASYVPATIDFDPGEPPRFDENGELISHYKEISGIQPTSSYLPNKSYPLNPYRTVYSRFRKLQQENKDIVAWLKIDEILDEAVVQRNNTYYLNRDYRGYHNNNGALFLDEGCDLSFRPYTLIVYGHNMKTGAMFGSLREYEKISYYKQHSIIQFDTMYEDGQFVVFAVSRTSTIPHALRYVDVLGLLSCTIENRIKEIDKIVKLSQYGTAMDVKADDQLLFLITCTGKDEERLIIAARRFRDGETLEELIKKVDNAYKKD